MLLRNARLTLPAIIVLVLLRIAVGWHFFQEGAAKVREGNFSSTGFLSAAKGPFAEQFHAMVPDYNGAIRTSPKEMEAACEAFVEKAAKMFEFTDEQSKQAKDILAKFKEERKEIYSEWKAQIDEYRKGIERIETLNQDPVRNDKMAILRHSSVDTLRKQKDDIESKWKALGKPILSEIDYTVKELEQQINAIPTDVQAAPDPKRPSKRPDGSPVRRYLDFKYPGEGSIDVKAVDKIIPIFDLVVGILMIVGLLTPVAALAAGLFLASVVATQFPGSYGAQPTYYQAIEMLACFVLAFSDAGRYGGLDFLPWAFWKRSSPKPVHA